MPQHMFYGDNTLLDLRFLAAAEPVNFDDESEEEYGIGCLLEVGHTPQRVMFLYATAQQRDEAFSRLIALHQTWDNFLHSQQDIEDCDA